MMKRSQKKFERDPRKKICLRAKPYRLVKAKNCEQRSQFNYINFHNGGYLQRWFISLLV